jgi:hypothetical protein
MKIVQDKEETGTTVVMDDTSFVNCTFTDCILIYHGGDSAWPGTSFVNCKFSLQGPAAKTAITLQTFGWKPPVSTHEDRVPIADKTVN